VFVTQEKTESQTQYNDYIDGNLLFWEGEKKHRSDRRIISARANGDEIHLFYRWQGKMPFTYLGIIWLLHSDVRDDSPSKFIFRIEHFPAAAIDALDDLIEHQNEIESMPDEDAHQLRKSRIGRGRFRNLLVQRWGGCAATDLREVTLLRASHIKPWRDCTNTERMDVNNGLLMAPHFASMFRTGYISFAAGGSIILSDALQHEQFSCLKPNGDEALSYNGKKLQQYLRHHRENILLA